MGGGALLRRQCLGLILEAAVNHSFLSLAPDPLRKVIRMDLITC